MFEQEAVVPKARELSAAYRSLVRARLHGSQLDEIQAWDRCALAADAVEDAIAEVDSLAARDDA